MPILPLVHRPTFVYRDCSAPLLLNAIALGSLFLGTEDATETVCRYVLRENIVSDLCMTGRVLVETSTHSYRHSMAGYDWPSKGTRCMQRSRARPRSLAKPSLRSVLKGMNDLHPLQQPMRLIERTESGA